MGRAEGLIVDLNDRQVTLVLLLHGHLWGAKSVSIPIDSITSLDFDGAHTSLPERDINALPEMRHAARGTRLSPRTSRWLRRVPATARLAPFVAELVDSGARAGPAAGDPFELRIEPREAPILQWTLCCDGDWVRAVNPVNWEVVQ